MPTQIRRVVVLGAGATRGATTTEGKVCQPPLNADFFTQLQRISGPKHSPTATAVIQDVVDIFGAGFDLTMEDYFTQLESIAKMSKLAGRQSAAFSPQEITAKRDRLMKALAAVLEESTDVSRADSDVCEHHEALVGALGPNDTIISFNYDCVVDHALRRTADGQWSAKYGYSFTKPSRIQGHDHWDADHAPTSASDSIQLLKLHGSLNWQLPTGEDASAGTITLKQRLYQQNGTPRFTIIPPESVKNIDGDENFRTLWRCAERAIRKATSIAFVGFSFTPTDLHVESLFRLAVAKKTDLQTLIIANPSAEHRRRIRQVFTQPLSRGSMVRQYENLEEFAGQLAGDIWTA